MQSNMFQKQHETMPLEYAKVQQQQKFSTKKTTKRGQNAYRLDKQKRHSPFKRFT